MRQNNSKTVSVLLALALFVSGCTSTVVRDDVKQTAGPFSHCAGSEWVDNSSLAVLPVPVVAFFVPHFDLHRVSAESYLNRCGVSTSLVNRDLSINKIACVPAGLTRIVTLGIWQWCPAHVSWSADVLATAPRPTVLPTDDRSKPQS